MILFHPDLPSEQTIDVEDDAVRHYVRSGWLPVEGTEPDTEPEPKTPARPRRKSTTNAADSNEPSTEDTDSTDGS